MSYYDEMRRYDVTKNYADANGATNRTMHKLYGPDIDTIKESWN